MKKLLTITLVALLLVTGCKKIPKLENGQEAVVSLGKNSISTEDLYEQMKEKYAFSVLIDMIDSRILNEKYESTDDEKSYIKSNVELTKTYYDSYYSQMYSSYESFLIQTYNVQSEEELKTYLSLRYKRNKAIEDYAKSKVSEGDIKDYYEDELIGDMEASHILITAEYSDGASENEIKAAEEEALKVAKEVIKKLDSGEKFEDLAKTYSKDGSGENGGALGRFGHGDMVEEFEQAAYKLEVGKYTKEPVKTKYGYHIILKTKQYDKPELSEVKDEILETLANRILDEEANISIDALDALRKDNGMEINDSVLKQQYENYLINSKN